MLLEELREYYGTWANMARKLELGHTSYQLWKSKGCIPFNTQCVIEKKTKGKFKANEAHAQPQK